MVGPTKVNFFLRDTSYKINVQKFLHTYLSYLGTDLNLFRDREDPCLVYVILKNKLFDGILKDFYLNNGVTLAKRLYDALPDHYLNARHYIDEVRKVLQAKTGDHTFSRKMGLNICSMLLGIEHQRKFDVLMARADDSPLLKEPFDREIRGKMVTFQKQALDGFDRFQQLGALSKKTTDLLGMYSANKMPVPSSSRKFGDGRGDRKRRSNPDRSSYSKSNELRQSRTRKSQGQSKRPRTESKDSANQSESRKEVRKQEPKDVEAKQRSKTGEKKNLISKLNKRDLQGLIKIAVSNNYEPLIVKFTIKMS